MDFVLVETLVEVLLVVDLAYEEDVCAVNVDTILLFRVKSKARDSASL